jgi:hypothetical protein
MAAVQQRLARQRKGTSVRERGAVGNHCCSRCKSPLSTLSGHTADQPPGPGPLPGEKLHRHRSFSSRAATPSHITAAEELG